MSGAKKFVVGLLVTLLWIFSMGATYSYLALKTVHNRDVVKGWLDKGQFYDSIVEAALQNVSDAGDKKGVDIPVSDPGVQQKIKDVFTPEFLKTNTEKVLDGIYNWLDGKTKNPEFVIDFADSKQKIADAIGSYAAEKASELPTCTPDQITPEFDAFSSSCLPPGLSSAAAGDQVKSALLSDEGFFKKGQINGAEIKLGGDTAQPIGESKAGKLAKLNYKLSAFLPIIFGLFGLLCAFGIVFLSTPRAHGVRRVGFTFLVVGILVGINYLLLFVLQRTVEDKVADWANTPAVRNIIANMVKAIVPDIRKDLLLFVIGFLVASILLIVLASLMKNGRKIVDNEPDNNDRPLKPASPTPARPTPPAAPRPQATTAPTLPKRGAAPAPAKRPESKRPPRKIQL